MSPIGVTLYSFLSAISNSQSFSFHWRYECAAQSFLFLFTSWLYLAIPADDPFAFTIDDIFAFTIPKSSGAECTTITKYLDAATSKGSLPNGCRNQYDGTSLGENSLYCEVHQQGDRRQGTNLSPSTKDQGKVYKGFQHQIFLDSGSFSFERVPVLGFQSCPQSLVPWWGVVKGSQVLLLSDIFKV